MANSIMRHFINWSFRKRDIEKNDQFDNETLRKWLNSIMGHFVNGLLLKWSHQYWDISQPGHFQIETPQIGLNFDEALLPNFEVTLFQVSHYQTDP